MAVYQLEQIARDVRIAIDKNMTSEELVEIGDVDTLSNEDIIRSKVCDAIKRVHSEAPFYLLDGGYNFGEAIYWGDQCSGWVLLPDNFMRFVVFEMSDWERPVFSALTPNDDEYVLLRSRFKGLRGTTQRPVCAISMRPEGRVLEFYSCKSEEAQVSKAVYLPYPEIDDNDGVEICSRCYDAVVYTIASLVLSAFGDIEKGNLLTELAKTALI